jgi:hypothetical protein
MRRPFFLIFVNLGILLVLLAMLTQSLFIVQRVAITEELRGHVDVQRGGRGDFRPLSKDSLVKTNDVVRAAQDGSAEFRWPDGMRMRVTPGTQLAIQKVSFNSAARANSSEFKLDSGKIFVRIVRSLAPNSKFEVETPTAVASVRGTIFSVEVKNGKTQVAVYKGEVKVSSESSSGGKASTITPGQIAVSSTSGVLETLADTSQNAAFEAQKSIITPELRARVLATQDPKTLLIVGQTEAGDNVTIDGKPARVLGNGSYRLRVPIKTDNAYQVKVVDKHGATASIMAKYEAAESPPDVAATVAP